jgi:D-alanyl-D-alanine carboxypeptidase (penicillin-binding protein 5/6)
MGLSRRYFIAITCLCGVLVGVAAREGLGAPELNSEHAILMDYDTGDILYEKRADDIMAPSSTTKIMTAYLIFEMLNAGTLSLDSKFKVSIRAWRQDGTRMFLEPEWKVTVHELLMGAIVASGNDAAVTLAEGSAGAISNFVDRMNEVAKNLGMTNTHFDNPTGLYEKTHYMSVRDLAILTRALIESHGEHYSRYFSQQSFSFNGVTQKNKNPLLGEYDGVDGVKTGHTDQGKYSIVVSALRNGKRLIAVLARTETDRDRTTDAKALLDYGFAQYSYLRLFRKGEVVKTVDAPLSRDHEVRIYTDKDIGHAFRKTRNDDIRVQLVHDKYIFRHVNKNDVMAQLIIEDGNLVIKYDLYAQNDSKKLGGFKTFLSLLRYNFRKLFSPFRHESSKVLEQ